ADQRGRRESSWFAFWWSIGACLGVSSLARRIVLATRRRPRPWSHLTFWHGLDEAIEVQVEEIGHETSHRALEVLGAQRVSDPGFKHHRSQCEHRHRGRLCTPVLSLAQRVAGEALLDDLLDDCDVVVEEPLSGL